METEGMTYGKAMERLEALVAEMEEGELDIDLLGSRLKEAQELVRFCRGKLCKADEEVKKIMEGDGQSGEA